MNRLTIFSFYDPKNQIDNYVIHYLKELKKVSDIIFVTDCVLENSEIEKIENLVIQTSNFRHGEYDFGSYKIGFNIAKKQNLLEKYNWIILANDSCYGPFCNLVPIFNKMESKNIDFWGFSLNNVDRTPHLQTYFVALNSTAFSSDTFQKFISSIEPQKIRRDIIIKYEHGLTKQLSEAGFSYASFFTEKKDKFKYDPARKWDIMIKKGYPFMKRTLFTRNTRNHKNLKNYQRVISKYFPDYNLDLIVQNLDKYTTISYVSKINRLKNWFKN